MDFDHALIARRGATVVSDSEYRVVCCSVCQTQFLYDVETLLLYSDPSDLLHPTLAIQPSVPCPACGAADWSFAEVPDSVAIRGPWAWSFHVPRAA